MKRQKHHLISTNSFTEFLLYTTPNGQVKVEIFLRDETIWLTQEKIAILFGVQRPTITKHLKNIFESGELFENSVSSILEHTADDGKNYKMKFYNLDAILSVGYRVNSLQATQFRIWATERLREYIIKGFTMDDERLKNPRNIFGKDYFDEQLARIRDIRSSERRFYQKITDIYAQCSADYDPNEVITRQFFATVQNKLHFAITGQTAAEIIHERVSSAKPNMGLTTWKHAPDGAIRETDVVIAKNYLSEPELDRLNRIVTMYLDYAELQAERGVLMRMKDWVAKLDAFLQFNEKQLLDDAGKVSHEVAEALALQKYKDYRVAQDKTHVSDFDKVVKKLVNGENGERALKFISQNCPEEDKLVTISNDEIIKYCERLKPADWVKMATKTQTVKDIVAHLVGWQRECVYELEKSWNSGADPWFGLTDDYDEFNAKIRTEFHSSKPSELLEEFRHWDSALNKTITKVGEDNLRVKSEFDWVMDEGEDSHFLNHFLQIKKAVEV